MFRRLVRQDHDETSILRSYKRKHYDEVLDFVNKNLKDPFYKNYFLAKYQGARWYSVNFYDIDKDFAENVIPKIRKMILS